MSYSTSLEAHPPFKLVQSIHINPSYAWAYDGKGDSLLRLGRLDEAIDAYNQVMDIVSFAYVCLMHNVVLSIWEH